MKPLPSQPLPSVRAFINSERRGMRIRVIRATPETLKEFRQC